MISREKKETIIADAREKFNAAQAIFIAENAGLSAAEMTDLRARARAGGGRAQVIKNTLAKRAMEGGPFAALGDSLSGPLIFGAADEAAGLAKVFSDLARDNEKFVLRGGALAQGAPLDVAAIGKLASIPPRPLLLASLLSAMQGPASGLARTLNEVPSRFVRVLAAVRDAKDSGQ